MVYSTKITHWLSSLITEPSCPFLRTRVLWKHQFLYKKYGWHSTFFGVAKQEILNLLLFCLRLNHQSPVLPSMFFSLMMYCNILPSLWWILDLVTTCHFSLSERVFHYFFYDCLICSTNDDNRKNAKDYRVSGFFSHPWNYYLIKQLTLPFVNQIQLAVCSSYCWSHFCSVVQFCSKIYTGNLFLSISITTFSWTRQVLYTHTHIHFNIVSPIIKIIFFVLTHIQWSL